MIRPALLLSEDIAGDESLLGPEEKLRLLRLHAPKRKAQFLKARTLLRLGLQELTGQAPSSFQISALAGQGPKITGGPAASIAHSSWLSACLVSPEGACGLDVEDAGVARDFGALGLHEFGQRLTGPEFYEAWCLKEARTKGGEAVAGIFKYKDFQGALVLAKASPLDCLLCQSGAFKKIDLEIKWL